MLFTRRATPLLISVEKISDSLSHCAFTDLIRYKNQWLTAYRESSGHATGHGGIRLLISLEGVIWKNLAFLEEPGKDLRDPKLSIMPNGHLMLLTCAVSFAEGSQSLVHQSCVSICSNGVDWSPFVPVLEQGEWLWKVTWYQGTAYGVSYRFTDLNDADSEWITVLHKSHDGINYKALSYWQIPGKPNEAALQFHQNGHIIALVRREGHRDNHCWLGRSDPPYVEWRWITLDRYLGGPNFIILPNEIIWASGRMCAHTPYGVIEKTVLARLSANELIPALTLPSRGDTGYPGMVLHEGYLWMTYYSSHQNNAAIYFAKVQLPAD